MLDREQDYIVVGKERKSEGTLMTTNNVVAAMTINILTKEYENNFACSGLLDMPPNSSQDRPLLFSETEKDDTEVNCQGKYRTLNLPWKRCCPVFATR